MAKSRFQSALERKINDEITQVMVSLSSGDAPDFGNYRYWAGFIKGLQAALRFADETEGEIEG